ncbi:MAG: DUF3305 domain-containing protein [Rhodospirillales bacterium]|nr:MAG: DUF3305 domain-containing protein [Rhodospirillales bacterium]
MERTEALTVGIVVERRDSSHPWQEQVWLPVAVLPGVPAADPAAPWKRLKQGEGWEQYLAGTLTIEVHRTDTEAYLDCLSAEPPRVFVVLQEDPQSAYGVRPFLATVSTYEAQDYADAGENIVEGVTMPDSVIAWLKAFVAAHHIAEPFRKRRLRRSKEDGAGTRPRYGRGSGWSEGHEF